MKRTNDARGHPTSTAVRQKFDERTTRQREGRATSAASSPRREMPVPARVRARSNPVRVACASGSAMALRRISVVSLVPGPPARRSSSRSSTRLAFLGSQRVICMAGPSPPAASIARMPSLPGLRFHGLLDGRGSALAVDSSGPNTAAPPERFVAAVPSDGLAGGFALWPLDGTTVTVAVWVYEEALATWVLWKAGTTVAATASAPVLATNAGLLLPRGARVYLQVTSNTGVTKLGWRYS